MHRTLQLLAATGLLAGTAAAFAAAHTTPGPATKASAAAHSAHNKASAAATRAENAVARGAKATERGIQTGVKAANEGADKVARKVGVPVPASGSKP